MRITAERLRKLNACEEQVTIFEAEWPGGCNVTKANCRRALELGLDTHWAAVNLLRPKADKAYDEASAQAWKVRREAIAQARKAYNEAIALAFWRAATGRIA